MVLVGFTTPLNILSERVHQVSNFWKNWFYNSSALLFITIILGYFVSILNILEYIVVIYLGLSILGSMIFIRMTKPKKKVLYREKMEQNFAIIFMITIPLSLFITYVLETKDFQLKIGFTIPLVFILLAGNKLWEDLQRLSLLKPQIHLKEQNLQELHTHSKRARNCPGNLVKAYHISKFLSSYSSRCPP